MSRNDYQRGFAEGFKDGVKDGDHPKGARTPGDHHKTYQDPSFDGMTDWPVGYDDGYWAVNPPGFHANAINLRRLRWWAW
ncbi:hypothetical protein ACFXG4_49130 [Nocardia sp. NPDC059246]|uniref:hypothetical protein n=1 Tax=unclassified Nocardia TaxID=2637762 RepID=UPI0036C83ED2